MLLRMLKTNSYPNISVGWQSALFTMILLQRFKPLITCCTLERHIYKRFLLEWSFWGTCSNKHRTLKVLTPCWLPLCKLRVLIYRGDTVGSREMLLNFSPCSPLFFIPYPRLLFLSQKWNPEICFARQEGESVLGVVPGVWQVEQSVKDLSWFLPCKLIARAM